MRDLRRFLAIFFLFALIFQSGTTFGQPAAEKERQGLLPRRSRNADNGAEANRQSTLQAVPQNAPQAAAQNVPQGAPQAGRTTAPVAPADPNEFIIPEGATPDELMAKADKLLNTEREFNTEEEYNTWFAKMIQTVFLISQKILAADIDDTTYLKATNLQGEMIYSYGTIKPEAFSVFENYVRRLPNDARLMKTDEGKKIADSQLAGFLHWGCTRTVQQNGTPEEMKKYIDEFLTLLQRNPDYAEMVPELIYPISEFANDKKDPQILKAVLGDFIAGTKNSDKPELKEVAVGLEGMLRFADLKGKPFEMIGSLADGGEFDSASLKGKIVLVNFWATWATPCLAQYPDLLALYIQYKDKGFEIVGYSVDEDVAKLNDYLTTKKVLWPNLSETVSREKKLPLLTEFYGITGVPTMILIDRNGRVLENDMELEQLKVKLDEMFK